MVVIGAILINQKIHISLVRRQRYGILMQTHQTSGDGNEECCSEIDAKTMKKNLRKTFQKNLTTISKIRYRQKKT